MRVSKKKLLFLRLLLIFLCISNSVALQVYASNINDYLYPAGYSFNRLRSSLRLGYINNTGEWVAWPVFDSVASLPMNPPIERTSEGLLYPANFKGKSGYLNSSGQWAIYPKYNSVREFRCDRAIVFQDEAKVIDPKGNVVFTVDKNEKIGSFSEGLAWKTVTDEKTGIQFFGYVDIDNNWIIAPKFLFDEAYTKYYNFSQGSALLIDQNDSEYLGLYYIDKSGNRITQQYFQQARPFSEGYAAVKIDEKWGFINSSGDWVIYPQFQYAWPFSEGLAAVIDEENQGKYINDKGNFKFSFHYYGLLLDDFRNDVNFCEGLAGVYESDSGGKKGYIDQTGQWVISPQFQYTGPFQNGIAYVQYSGSNTATNGSYGYINTQGESIIKWEYW